MPRYFFRKIHLIFREIERITRRSIETLRYKGPIYFLKLVFRFFVFKIIPEKPHDSQYKIWIGLNHLSDETRTTFCLQVERFKNNPVISLLVPVFNTDLVCLKKTIHSVLNQIPNQLFFSPLTLGKNVP